MMDSFNENKEFSDKFVPEIKSILGRVLIEENFYEDLHHNTDLQIVLRSNRLRIGCRVRRARFYPAFANQFTHRAIVPSGAKTELDKILEGWGDYFFYGFSDTEEKTLQAWFLGNLEVFRLWYLRQRGANNNMIPGVLIPNRDGTKFRVFECSEMPEDFEVYNDVIFNIRDKDADDSNGAARIAKPKPLLF